MVLLSALPLILLSSVVVQGQEQKKCKFNGKGIAVGQVAYQLVDNCVELVCTNNGKKSLLVLQHIAGCTFIDTTTVAPTTLPPAPKCQYKKEFGDTHTMALKRNKECKSHKSGVSEDEKQIILKTHNDLRTQVARGKEKLGNPGPQPKASNMREMIWNAQLAEVAQAWADQCPNGHDAGNDRRICGSSYKNVGQNIYTAFGGNDEHAWEKSVAAWYNEVKYMPNTDVDTYQAPPEGVIGHYTQVVWAKTYEVGCGAVHYECEHKGHTYSNCKKYVCNYGPGGNYKKATIYQQGKTASECENGKSESYPSLCK